MPLQPEASGRTQPTLLCLGVTSHLLLSMKPLTLLLPGPLMCLHKHDLFLLVKTNAGLARHGGTCL